MKFEPINLSPLARLSLDSGLDFTTHAKRAGGTSTVMKPHLETFVNPLYKSGDGFTHYEIQTIREYQSPDGIRFIEPVISDEDASEDHPYNAGPVYFGIYGRMNVGGVEHIADRATLEQARHTLSMMGIY